MGGHALSHSGCTGTARSGAAGLLLRGGRSGGQARSRPEPASPGKSLAILSWSTRQVPVYAFAMSTPLAASPVGDRSLRPVVAATPDLLLLITGVHP